MMNVMLRIVEDPLCCSYERSIKVLNKTSVEILESPATMIDGFLKKDKLVYSPTSNILSQQPEDLMQFPLKIFQFDSIITDFPILDSSRSSIIISIGKSDTFSNKSGLISQTVSSALQENMSVQVSSSFLHQGRMISLLSQAISSSTDLEKVLENFNSIDKSREGLLMTFVKVEKNFNKKVFLFCEFFSTGKMTDLVLNFLTNKEITDKVPGDDAIFDALGQALAYYPKILIIGNISPITPHINQTKSLLEFLSLFNEKKGKIGRICMKTLMLELKKVNSRNLELEKISEEREKMIEKMKQEQKVSDLENSSLKDKIFNYRKDQEIEKMMKQISLFQEKYLIKQAELAELEQKLDELNEMKGIRRDSLEKKPSFKKDPLAMELDFSRKNISQDFATSPIKSFALTERTALTRIEELSKDLEYARSSLKVLKDKEDLLNFEVPRETLDHFSYYQIITTLFKAIGLVRTDCEDTLQQEYNRVSSLLSLYENRDQFIRQKLSNLQDIHSNKLKYLQEVENDLVSTRIENSKIKKELVEVKETFAEFQIEVLGFKNKCKEKLARAMADVDLKKEVKKKDEEIEALNQELNNIKTEVLAFKDKEIEEIRRKYDLEIEKLSSDNAMLKKMTLVKSK
jgi:hypothetical protein